MYEQIAFVKKVHCLLVVSRNLVAKITIFQYIYVYIHMYSLSNDTCVLPGACVLCCVLGAW